MGACGAFASPNNVAFQVMHLGGDEVPEICYSQSASVQACTALSGSISRILTVLSWVCVGIPMCGALTSPVRA